MNEQATVTARKHGLCSREENYRDDSDFYQIVYNEDADCLERIDTGSTRYAGGIADLPICNDEAILQNAEAALARWCAPILKSQDVDAIECPGKRELTPGTYVLFTVDGKYTPKSDKPSIEWKAGDRIEILACEERRSRYGTWSQGFRINFRTDDGRYGWTALKPNYSAKEGPRSNVRLQRAYLTDEQITAKAARLAASRCWYVPFTRHGLPVW